MKDLEMLAARCEEELGSIGIKCGKVRSWSVNTRAKSRWGQCRQIAKGVFDIDISEQLLQDEVDELAAKTTIIHELLHTVEGCVGHKGKWKELAGLVGRNYPQYQIRRTSSFEDKGILKGNRCLQKAGGWQKTQPQSQNREPKGRYRITCTGCGICTYRQRASRLVKCPQEFRCAKCGGRLRVEKLAESF